LPAAAPYTKLHAALQAEGFMIYAGRGDLSKTAFRISAMGAVTSAYLSRLSKCLAQPV
jgi:2-aminoethylphosphonate-pyruvate transaminase